MDSMTVIRRTYWSLIKSFTDESISLLKLLLKHIQGTFSMRCRIPKFSWKRFQSSGDITG